MAARRAARAGKGGRGGRRPETAFPALGGGSRPDLRPHFRPESLRKLLPQALVVAFLAGGTVAFLAGDKDVRLTVDGEPRTLHTFADDVGEVLAQQGVTVGEHDLVAPGPQAELHDGDQVEVRYGRPVTLTLDGQQRRVWTTAATVDEALRELGVRAEGAHLSASRRSTIGRHGLDLVVRTERTVTLLADGRERTVRTNAATVRELVARSGIVLRNQDTTSVDPDSFPREGQTISVLRIYGSEEVREEPVGFRTEKHKDAKLFQGTEAVDTKGKPGVRRVRYAFRTVNGVQQKAKIVRSEIVREPVTQVVRVGTKPLPTSVAGTDGLNWRGLAHCEAGGRPHAVDPSGTYGGLYQFDTRTWHSLGGRGRPQDASAGEQTFRAKRLYIQRGSSPWPVCGRKLGG
ncbi:ubiquitin-like domain-containing protein [Streptomyces sp. H39-S7]|nr:resuscitation-promoting factor [Streptomyces sp. H39-S7]MCZ4125175.1 ubiquitin-like domain-containing protein [Streptomyces sp. H39-S7]